MTPITKCGERNVVNSQHGEFIYYRHLNSVGERMRAEKPVLEKLKNVHLCLTLSMS